MQGVLRRWQAGSLFPLILLCSKLSGFAPAQTAWVGSWAASRQLVEPNSALTALLPSQVRPRSRFPYMPIASLIRWRSP